MSDEPWSEAAGQKTNTNDDFAQGSGKGGSSSDNGGSNGGYGYGYDSSGYGSSPSPQQEKAADNLGSIVNWNQGTILGSAKNADDVFDVSDKQNENLRALRNIQSKRNAGNDWYTQQQRLQSVTANLRESMGNALYGSTLYDLWDLLARKDDMDDVEVLNAMRENINNNDNQYWEAIMANNNARNESYLDTEQNLRDLAGDYAAQLNNIHPDLAKDVIPEKGEDGKPGDLNIPEWLQTEYFKEHMRQALEPTEQGLFRPDTAAPDAWSNGLLTGQKNNSSSTNQSYWDKMFAGYNRRTQ